jgi:hypothetical protein
MKTESGHTWQAALFMLALCSHFSFVTPTKAQEDLNMLALRAHNASIEYYLTQSIHVRKIRRVVNGLYEVTFGTFVLSLAMSQDIWTESTTDSDRYIVGGIGLLFYSIGLGQLLRPSKYEHACDEVLQLSNAGDRRNNGESLLHSAAKEAKSSRITTGVVSLLIAGHHLIAKPYSDHEANIDEVAGIVFAVGGMLKLLFRSPEEKLLQEYQSSSQSPSINASLSIHPQCRYQLQLILNIK